jgi:hypothetical protein
MAHPVPAAFNDATANSIVVADLEFIVVTVKKSLTKKVGLPKAGGTICMSHEAVNNPKS